MATLGTYLIRLRERLSEPDEGFWSNSFLRATLNEAARDIARRSEALTVDATLTIVAGTESYALPTTVVKVLEPITFTPTGSSYRYPITPIERHAAITRWGMHQDIGSGTPDTCVATGYAPSMSLLFYPSPSTGGVVNYRYAKFPTDLTVTGSNDSSTLDVPGGWDDVALDYAEWKCWLKRRNREMAADARERYVSGLAGLTEAGNRQIQVPGSIFGHHEWSGGWDW
jgi:hypothetical protein